MHSNRNRTDEIFVRWEKIDKMKWIFRLFCMDNVDEANGQFAMKQMDGKFQYDLNLEFG